MPRAAMPASRKTSSISPRPQPRSSTGACSRKRDSIHPLPGANVVFAPAKSLGEFQPIDVRELGRRAFGHLLHGARERSPLPHQPQFGMNHALVFGLRRGPVRPKIADGSRRIAAPSPARNRRAELSSARGSWRPSKLRGAEKRPAARKRFARTGFRCTPVFAPSPCATRTSDCECLFNSRASSRSFASPARDR